MATNNAFNNAIAAANSAITLNSGTNAVNISTDAAATTLSIGTGAASKVITLGSDYGTASLALKSGAGGININSGIGAIAINSATGVLGISTDNEDTALSIGTGGATKTLTLGSTNTTSTTNLQSGSGGINIPAFAEGALITSSAGKISTVTGTAGYVLTANGAGTAPSFQAASAASVPAFAATTTSDATNITGDGTFFTLVCGTELFDVGGNYDHTTGIFTAPSTGNYVFAGEICFNNLGSSHTVGVITVTPTAGGIYRNYQYTPNPANLRNVGNYCDFPIYHFVPLTAGDTAKITAAISNGTKVVGYYGSSSTFFYGYKVS
jgi:hypothetical protein